MLYYSIAYPDSGNNFGITIVPINELGTGEPAIAPIVDLKGNYKLYFSINISVCNSSCMHELGHLPLQLTVLESAR